MMPAGRQFTGVIHILSTIRVTNSSHDRIDHLPRNLTGDLFRLALESCRNSASMNVGTIKLNLEMISYIILFIIYY